MGLSNPDWIFTAVDPSDDMLSICNDNVRRAGISNRVSIHCGNLDTLSEGVTYDAATSILVSHFIKEKENRMAFYKLIADKLVDKGVLITADIIADKSLPSFDIFVKAWKSHYANSGIPADEVEEDLERSLKTVSLVPETAIMNMLLAAGYKIIHQFYRALLFSGWMCFKSTDKSDAPNKAL